MRFRIVAIVSACLLVTAPVEAQATSPKQLGQVSASLEDFASDTMMAVAQGGMIVPEALTFAQAMRRLNQGKLDAAASASVSFAAGLNKAAVARGYAALALLRGQQGSALIFLLRAAELAPKDTDTLEMLAGLVIGMGLANEGRAILAEIDRLGPDNKGGAINAEVVRKYLKGYADYLNGNYDDAIRAFYEAGQGDPKLTLVDSAIAVVELKRGNRAKAAKSVADMVWKGLPKKRLVLIRRYKDAEIVTPATLANMNLEMGDYLQIPAADLFNISKGKPSALPKFPDPETPEDLLKWQKVFERQFHEAGLKFYDMTIPYQPLTQELGRKSTEDLGAFVATNLRSRMITLSASEPEMMELWRSAEKERKAMEAVVKAINDAYTKQVNEETARAKGSLSCGRQRQLITDTLSRRRAAAVSFKNAFDRFYRLHGQYATALAMQTPIKAHRKLLENYAKSRAMQYWSTYYNQIYFAYTVYVSDSCFKDGSGLSSTMAVEEPIDDQCPEWMQGKGVEIKLGGGPVVEGAEPVGLTMGLSCDTWNLELSGEIADIPGVGSLSVFAQAEYARAGALTLYGGFKAETAVMGGIQTGIYGTIDSDGSLIDMGGKGSITGKIADQTGGRIPVDVGFASEEMKFSILPEAWAKPGPKIKVGDPIKIKPKPKAPPGPPKPGP